MSLTSKISPALFILSILSFLITFATLSCQGQALASFTGIQLATGATVQQPKMFGPSQKQKIGPEPFASIALLCAVVGAGVSFVGIQTPAAPAISGIAGALSLLIMKSHVDGEIATRGQGMFQVTYGPGFYLALSLMIVGSAWNCFLLWPRAKMPVPGPPAQLPR